MKKRYSDWVLKCKQKGTAIPKIGENFYLYKVESKGNKELKRARKITKGYLGKITPKGLKEPGYKINSPTTCKEYGASRFLLLENKQIIERLKEYFPIRWKELFVLSVFRLIYQSPLKHMELHYQDSWLSQELPDTHLSKNTLHKILESVGRDRKLIVEFLRSLICGNENLLIELTPCIFLIGEYGFGREGIQQLV